jgi:hypothetical protein
MLQQKRHAVIDPKKCGLDSMSYRRYYDRQNKPVATDDCVAVNQL